MLICSQAYGRAQTKIKTSSGPPATSPSRKDPQGPLRAQRSVLQISPDSPACFTDEAVFAKATGREEGGASMVK